MKLLARHNPHVPPPQAWTWHLVTVKGRTDAASSEGFTTLAGCRNNAQLTMDGIWEHIALGGGVNFSNESALSGMGKKSKAIPVNQACGPIKEGDIMSFSDGTRIAVTFKQKTAKKAKGAK